MQCRLFVAVAAAVAILGFSISPGLAQTPSSVEPPRGLNTGTGKAIPANQAIRFVIPYYHSFIQGQVRSFTGIIVMNNSGGKCEVSISFQLGPPDDRCLPGHHRYPKADKPSLLHARG